MPHIPMTLMCSRSTAAPSRVAQAGLRAQNKPARWAVVWLCATGWRGEAEAGADDGKAGDHQPLGTGLGQVGCLEHEGGHQRQQASVPT